MKDKMYHTGMQKPGMARAKGAKQLPNKVVGQPAHRKMASSKSFESLYPKAK